MSRVVCPDCDIEYEIKSKEAEEEGIIPEFCPFCGFETTEDLDFSDDTYEEDDELDLWDEDEYDL
jgi:hypothetical protein